MKRLDMLFLLLLLGCAPQEYRKPLISLTSPANNTEQIQMQQEKKAEGRKNACEYYTKAQKHDEKWKNDCVKDESGQKVLSAFSIDLLNEEPIQLCTDSLRLWGKPISNMVSEAELLRKIDCANMLKPLFAEGMKKLSPTEVCSGWTHRKYHPAELAAIDDEVRRRSIDCAAIEQTNAIRENTITQENNAIANSYMTMMLMNKIPTSCFTTDGTTHCY